MVSVCGVEPDVSTESALGIVHGRSGIADFGGINAAAAIGLEAERWCRSARSGTGIPDELDASDLISCSARNTALFRDAFFLSLIHI